MSNPVESNAAPFAPLLTEIEAARLLSLSRRTLQQWRVTGEGPPFEKLGTAVRYDPAELLAWRQRNARANTSGDRPAAA